MLVISHLEFKINKSNWSWGKKEHLFQDRKKLFMYLLLFFSWQTKVNETHLGQNMYYWN